jgi:competence protein ComEC
LAATFLAGIATGNFDDRRMQFEFSRFGLQHIMAISGFHFAIIACILGCLLRLVVPHKIAIISLIFLVSSYFVILGPTPSVMRAWLTILVALSGYLISKRGSALNSLGVAMLIVLAYDPHLCCHIGFQLSFLATAAILMLFNGIDQGLKYVFFQRPLSEVITMNRLNQHGYLILSCCRQGIALSLAVNLTTLPLLLYYFHKFSLMSLVYNLFFPFLVSLSMVMLILGLVGSIVFSPLGQIIHHINDFYTGFMLDYIYNMPRTLDRFLTVETVPLYAVILGLCLAFYLGVWMHHLTEKQKESQLDLAYL